MIICTIFLFVTFYFNVVVTWRHHACKLTVNAIDYGFKPPLNRERKWLIEDGVS